MGYHDIAIFGAGGFGLEVCALIQQINAVAPQWRMLGFFDDHKPAGCSINDFTVLGAMNTLNRWPTPLAVVVAIGTPRTRQAFVERIENPKISYPVLIHPTAIAGNAKYMRIGEGSIVCAGTIFTTNIIIGRHVIFNLMCTVGHETTVDDYCSFMPGCNISGEVIVGKASYWGTGAKIINRKSVGKNTLIGAGAVVTTDIPDNVTAVGVPARIMQNAETTLLRKRESAQ
ncbi:MAG: hypothetical protein VR64_11530 [Desulfatitalea sp. BRH_c12]|nr:MAG: hypothetical protein VR64_11530 [Desulfatitalea sp. BRH_c12]